MLSLIPWPGPTVFKISCPRDSARIVRRVIQSKWIPILDKFKVSLPLECPFHPQRDIFSPQELSKKRHRPSQWICGICGKSFFEEKYLDLHLDNRHKGYINMAEDAVCLADYCDIMRCDVLANQRTESMMTSQVNTDVEVWRETSKTRIEGCAKSLATLGPRQLAKFKGETNSGEDTSEAQLKEDSDTSKANSVKPGDPQGDTPLSPASSQADNVSDTTNSKHPNGDHLVESASPAAGYRPTAEQQRLKADCKPEELQRLKTKCEVLVRDCIAGLLIRLSDKNFKEIEDELNRAICWYLTCDRYWEDYQTEIRSFPWGLLCMVIMVASVGVCMCYYIVWVLFDRTDDVSVTSTSVTDQSTPSPARRLRHHPHHMPHAVLDGQYLGEDYYSEKDNEYIYVAYPPELKRRLLESRAQTNVLRTDSV
ncbi:unnamed protein product [Acanthoscelides obtectus]|nr:unnamed protein product [Acanthoscelides obtectus]CAK1665179.1 hypothetical protein AOBTE_LOCUS24698 [Acanthoscelides obtectus]